MAPAGRYQLSERRRERNAGGSFLDRKAIEPKGALQLLDLFRFLPGVEVIVKDDEQPVSLVVISSRGSRSVRNGGVHLGIEVYSAAQVPAEFRRPGQSCGPTLLWTRATEGAAKDSTGAERPRQPAAA